jgi:hypothetical protein
VLKKLNELFDVTYGNKLDLNKMTLLPRLQGGINFVGRSSQNHGVSGTVAPLPNVQPYDAGVITVSLGGTKLLSSFVQEYPFYTAQNVAVLKPLVEMTFSEKIFMCLCIRHNRFRYSAFGREANRTLRELLVPDLSEFPNWIHEFSVGGYAKLAAQGFQLHWQSVLASEQATASKASMTKFTCPEYGQSTWAKPGARLICGECFGEGEENICFMLAEQQT